MTIACYDTNIYISGTFWPGLPRQALLMAEAGEVDVIVCEALLAELADVLTRPGKTFRLSPREAAIVVHRVRSYTRMVEPTRKVTVCRDPKDDMVIECAVAGEAEFIVTGDPHLLDLKRFENVGVVTVREFIKMLGD